MRITVLEHPRISSEKRFNDIANTPLWSCLMGGYAAAALERGGFETSFIDDAVPSRTFEETAEKILDDPDPPDLLCINSVYFWEHTERFFDFLDILRERGFSGHINLFGFFPTLMYGDILSHSRAVDSIAVGEFEYTLIELATLIKRRVERNLAVGSSPVICAVRDVDHEMENIAGLAVRNGFGAILLNPRPPEKDPDLFAFPKRASLEVTVTILGSRGCYNHCSFCPVPSFYNQGALWRGRSPENIFSEMKELYDIGVREFYFADPNFIGPGKRGKERTLKLLRMIRDLNISFGMETRHQDLDDEIMEALIDSGFNSLLMGIESGSASVLGKLSKRADTEDGAKAIALCRKYNIEPEIGFLMFVPDSTLEDLRENLSFLKSCNLLEPLDRTANLLCHCQIILAGTSGYRSFEKEGRLKKTGIFGFEGDASFSDPRVEVVRDLTLFACHTVLRSMSDHSSPVYWRSPDKKISADLNEFLVDSFRKFLDLAEEKGTSINSGSEQKEVEFAIRSILSRR